MPRPPRNDVTGEIYHVINRANGRLTIFHTDKDYIDFIKLLSEMAKIYDIKLFAYVIMPNHWHLLVSPNQDKEVGRALQWLTTTHVRRHHTRKATVGYGHLYQGRYKSFPITHDSHLLSVLKYIARNPVRAKLSSKCYEWQWSSAYAQMQKTNMLSTFPIDLPSNYIEWIELPEAAEQLKAIRNSASKGIPLPEVDTANNITQ